MVIGWLAFITSPPIPRLPPVTVQSLPGRVGQALAESWSWSWSNWRPWAISTACDRSEVLSQVLLEFFPIAPTRLPSPFLPRENADNGDVVEADPRQCGKKIVPVDLALADIKVLVHSRG